MGILGLGRIGKEVAIRAKVQKVLQSFNCSVQSFNCSLSTAARQGIDSAVKGAVCTAESAVVRCSCEVQL